MMLPDHPTVHHGKIGVLLVNLTRTSSDGRWRTLDGDALYRVGSVFLLGLVSLLVAWIYHRRAKLDALTDR